MRMFRAAVATAAALGSLVAVAVAQAPVPTVTVTATPTGVSAAPTPVAPGATRFEFVSSAGADVGVFVVSPEPGRSADEVIAALRQNPDTALEMADLVASVSLPEGGRRAVTATIEAGRSYLLLNDRGEENPEQWVVAPLQTGGAPTGAVAPEPDAEVLMRDNRFAGDRRLPRDGTIRVRNVGWAPHFALAAPLRRGAAQRAVGRALLRGRERALGRLLDFRRSFELTNLLTRGATADQEVTFPKRGRYVLVCFFEGHNAQGMFRFVRVR